jgi:glucose/arabinose dehydrogenase
MSPTDARNPGTAAGAQPGGSRLVRRLIALCLVLLAAFGGVTGFEWITSRPSIKLESIADGFQQPTTMIELDGDLLVAERTGRIRAVGEAEPRFDLSDRVLTYDFEQGLLGMAVRGDRLFVDYTRLQDGATVVEALPLDGGQKETVIVVPDPGEWHNGGHLAFGPDGYLYMGLGDGGDIRLGKLRGQTTNDLLGAMLRIDVSGHGGYEIPPDNPFVGRPGYREELWAIGLRNPWQFNFDGATGDLYIADVGEVAREEVNRQPAGQGGVNYGWAVFEGSVCKAKDKAECRATGMTAPLIQYEHGLEECAIVGGYVYRGTAFPQWAGDYFFGDYCSGRIWSLDTEKPGATPRQLIDSDFMISAFAQDADGELYVLSFDRGAVYHLAPA